MEQPDTEMNELFSEGLSWLGCLPVVSEHDYPRVVSINDKEFLLTTRHGIWSYNINDNNWILIRRCSLVKHEFVYNNKTNQIHIYDIFQRKIISIHLSTKVKTDDSITLHGIYYHGYIIQIA